MNEPSELDDLKDASGAKVVQNAQRSALGGMIALALILGGVIYFRTRR